MLYYFINGFYKQNRLWLMYAITAQPIPEVGELYA